MLVIHIKKACDGRIRSKAEGSTIWIEKFNRILVVTARGGCQPVIEFTVRVWKFG